MALDTMNKFTGPREMDRIVAEAVVDADEGRFDNPEAYVTRVLHHAGYYQTGGGNWKRLGPDLRKKINFRQAVKQPDDRYYISEVDVFYPNATKFDPAGENQNIYTAQEISKTVVNTNRSIASGGQQPGLTKGHPHPLKKVYGDGETLPVYGKAINFRASDRGTGWVRCDLCDVTSDCVRDWHSGKYIGLSAGIVKDADGLNLRFGHVALLGADMQSLSYLPMTEIHYAAAGQLCFSTDPDLFCVKGSSMPDFASKQKAHSMCAAAYAAASAGEPGANQKVAEAEKALQALTAGTSGNPGEPAPGQADVQTANDADSSIIDGIVGGEGGAEGASAHAGDNPAETTDLPTEPEGENHTDPETTTDVTSTSSQKTFSADDYVALQRRVSKAELMNAALMGRQMKNEFSAEVDTLIASGHQIDKNATMDLFVNIVGNSKAVTSLRNSLKKTPKSPLTAGRTFSAGGNNPQPEVHGANADNSDAEVEAILKKTFPGTNFSADEIRMGRIGMLNV